MTRVMRTPDVVHACPLFFVNFSSPARKQMQPNNHHKTANKFSKNREESRHVTWESKGDHRVRSFVWRGGRPWHGGVSMGGRGSKYCVLNLPWMICKQNSKVASFPVPEFSTGLNLLWRNISSTIHLLKKTKLFALLKWFCDYETPIFRVGNCYLMTIRGVRSSL